MRIHHVYEELEKIDKFIEILEKSGIGRIIKQDRLKTKNTAVVRRDYNPCNLMAIILYCFAKFKGTTRKIEELCKYNIRIMYIMEQKTPSHVIICDFIKRYILPYQYEIFTMITKAIINEFNLDVSSQYLDGTKIEANANKYIYVWKIIRLHFYHLIF